MAMIAPPAGAAGAKAHKDARRRIGERAYVPYLFILPHLAIFLLMVGYPFFAGIYISLLDANNFTGIAAPFIGLENYAQLFDPADRQFDRFWQTLMNTVLFVLMSVPALIAIALGLAAILNGKFKGRTFFRAVYFAPWTLSVAVVGLLWFWIFQSRGGLIVDIFGWFGLEFARLAELAAVGLAVDPHCDDLVDHRVQHDHPARRHAGHLGGPL